MGIAFLDEENNVAFRLSLNAELMNTLTIQWQRLTDNEAHEHFQKRLQRHIESLLIQCLDWDLRPPTQAQMSYALSIAKKLQIDLPALALQRAGAMSEFLDEHSARFKELQY